VLLLATANMTETKIPIANEYVNGLYTDFTSGWYKDVGATLVKTMLIAAFVPIFEFSGIWSMKRSLRKMDRGFTNDEYKSKKKSI